MPFQIMNLGANPFSLQQNEAEAAMRRAALQAGMGLTGDVIRANAQERIAERGLAEQAAEAERVRQFQERMTGPERQLINARIGAMKEEQERGKEALGLEKEKIGLMGKQLSQQGLQQERQFGLEEKKVAQAGTHSDRMYGLQMRDYELKGDLANLQKAKLSYEYLKDERNLYRAMMTSPTVSPAQKAQTAMQFARTALNYSLSPGITSDQAVLNAFGIFETILSSPMPEEDKTGIVQSVDRYVNVLSNMYKDSRWLGPAMQNYNALKAKLTRPPEPSYFGFGETNPDVQRQYEELGLD